MHETEVGDRDLGRCREGRRFGWRMENEITKSGGPRTAHGEKSNDHVLAGRPIGVLRESPGTMPPGGPHMPLTARVGFSENEENFS